MRFGEYLNENIDELTKDELAEIADAQRYGEPEAAMLRVQFAMGGGVLNPVVEHVGDLTHRMCERATYHYAGYDYVKNKVEKTLMWLTNPYGFDREFRQNILNNANAKGVPVSEFKAKLGKALSEYAQSHLRIPVKNEVQRAARDAAVAIGEQDWNWAINKLLRLDMWLKEGK